MIFIWLPILFVAYCVPMIGTKIIVSFVIGLFVWHDDVYTTEERMCKQYLENMFGATMTVDLSFNNNLEIH